VHLGKRLAMTISQVIKTKSHCLDHANFP
jgi:hypothetical protein